ncbi:MAG TPA: hypothetical protein VJV23_16185 [Candidatus Polarisedimenticolia bacterium]|nr:hypothetical protein [Candidatus Polarisedimenticolia bacterium]
MGWVMLFGLSMAGVAITSSASNETVDLRPSAVIERIDPDVDHVRRAGFWQTGSAYGYFRLIVLSPLSEHSVSLLYLQKLQVISRDELVVVETKGVEQTNSSEGVFVTDISVLRDESGNESFVVDVHDRYRIDSLSRIKVVLKSDGTYDVQIDPRK